MYQLPALRFAYHDLEPHIAEAVLRRHHTLHHASYTKRLNAALERRPDLQGMTVEALLSKLPSQPPEVRTELESLAGGHANHQFQWKVISPQGRRAQDGRSPDGALCEAIERSFGSFPTFRDRFKAAALAQVGSGWAFLSASRFGAPDLEILVLPDNGSVLPLRKPGVLVCDLWEHAYDTQYPNDRADYLDAYFRVVDWTVCNARFADFAAGRMHTG